MVTGIKKGMYVDDVLTGDDDQVKLAEIYRQLMEMLHQAAIPIVLTSVPRQLWETKPERKIDRSPAVKTLGLLWFRQSDTFYFQLCHRWISYLRCRNYSTRY